MAQEEVTSTPVSAADQIHPHIRENYEQVRQERGLTWEQMAEQFAKDRNGHLLEAWARERAAAGDAPAGIESRGDIKEEKSTADAPKKSKRGNAKGLDPESV